MIFCHFLTPRQCATENLLVACSTLNATLQALCRIERTCVFTYFLRGNIAKGLQRLLRRLGDPCRYCRLPPLFRYQCACNPDTVPHILSNARKLGSHARVETERPTVFVPV